MASHWNGIYSTFLLLMGGFLLNSAASEDEVNNCSKSEEECAFPFTYSGVVYENTCVSGTLGYWCNTDGEYGWAYCGPCESATDAETSSGTLKTTTNVTMAAGASPTTVTPTLPASFTATRVSPRSDHVDTTAGVSMESDVNEPEIPVTTVHAPEVIVDTEPAATEANRVVSPTTRPEEPKRASTQTSRTTTTTTGATVKMTTTEKAPKVKPKLNSVKPESQMCTLIGETCAFPFTYGGATHTECVATTFRKWGWCYTDSKLGEYSDCIPCHLTTTTAVAAKTTTRESMTLLAIFTSKSTEPSEEIVATTVGPKDTGVEGTSDDNDNLGTVTIVVIVLVVLFVIVLVAVIYLYIVKLRRSKNAEEDEEKTSGNASAEGLLQHNKNGNHQTGNDDEQEQEMQPLNAKRIETGAGDFDVIKEDDLRADDIKTVTV